MELCIDTTTGYAAVAVCERGRARVELRWRSERNHSAELAPALREVMRRARVEVDDLTAVFAATGPGGFSSLRVGLSLAKSLAMARELPLVGVSSLDVEASPYIALGPPVAAVIGAGRSKVYIAAYEGTTTPTGERRVVQRESLKDEIEEGMILCGEEAEAVAGGLRPGVLAVAAPPPTRAPSALAAIAYERLRRGDADDPDTLQPLYLHSAQFKKAQQSKRRKTP